MNHSSASWTNWEWRTLALAGVCQCATYVDRIARLGELPDDSLFSALYPLYQLDPRSNIDAFGDPSRFSHGLQSVSRLLGNDPQQDKDNEVRYLLGMLFLSGKLEKSPDMLQIIRTRLKQSGQLFIEVRLDHDNLSPSQADDGIAHERFEEWVQGVAVLYQDTISRFSHRVQVKGKQEHLQKDAVASRIRALLLAGIRLAILWHQLGGRRLHLMLYRKRIIETAEALRKSLMSGGVH